MARWSCPNPSATARVVGGLFFPQRVPLKLDGRGYSPLVLEQIVTAGASVKSFEAAAVLLMKLAEVDVSPRHVNNLTTRVGEEVAEAAVFFTLFLRHGGHQAKCENGQGGQKSVRGTILDFH